MVTISMLSHTQSHCLRKEYCTAYEIHLIFDVNCFIETSEIIHSMVYLAQRIYQQKLEKRHTNEVYLSGCQQPPLRFESVNFQFRAQNVIRSIHLRDNHARLSMKWSVWTKTNYKSRIWRSRIHRAIYLSVNGAAHTQHVWTCFVH